MTSWKQRVKDAIAKHPKKKPLTSSGAEIPDPISQDPPLGYRPQPSMFEVIRKMIHDEKMRTMLAEEGLETPEEADDFDIEDDPIEPNSPYEHNFDPPAAAADVDQLQRMRDQIDERIRNLQPSQHAEHRGPRASAEGATQSQATPETPPAGGKISPAGGGGSRGGLSPPRLAGGSGGRQSPPCDRREPVQYILLDMYCTTDTNLGDGHGPRFEERLPERGYH